LIADLIVQGKNISNKAYVFVFLTLKFWKVDGIIIAKINNINKFQFRNVITYSYTAC